MTKVMPPKEFLHECFDLDEATGLLIWRLRPEAHFEGRAMGAALFGRHKKFDIGRPALNCIKKNGYRSGTLDGIYYYAHRVIWKMAHGEDPGIIDHINGDRTDNRLVNIRSGDTTMNQRNMPASKTSLDGVRGVYRHSQSGGWLGQINDDHGKVLSFYSKKREDVVSWRKSKENELGYLTRGIAS